MLINNDCLTALKGLPDNSIHSLVTDPPYGWKFMGKKWDYDIPSIEVWTECLRVLKPGAHALVCCGTRTQHRMAVNLEDAGFEIRDLIAWVYGSGFPKSLNIGKSVNQLETNEWSKIGKALDNTDQKSIIEAWKGNLNNVKIAETQSLKNQIIAGQDTPSENFVVLNVVQNSNQENSNLLVSFAEQNLNEAQAINTKINTALLSVETEIRQLQNNVKSAEQQSQNQNLKSWNIFTAQCDVKEWLNENTVVNHKVDEALKTLRGNKKYSNEKITSVLCAVIPSILKHAILNQSRTFQNLDTKSQTDFLSAINVIITKYTAENLISNTVAILKSKAIDKIQGNERETIRIRTDGNKGGGANTYDDDNYVWDKPFAETKGTSPYEGWGTALKPSMELWTLCRKPLIGTVAQNVLEYGTGGINIDGCRVEYQNDTDKEKWWRASPSLDTQNSYSSFKTGSFGEQSKLGRFPANLIHDGSDEVVDVFPNGSSRFFYCAKASKSERNMGCEGLEEVMKKGNGSHNGRVDTDPVSARFQTMTKNHHPTVKPVSLMRYLCRLITPPQGMVLDPYMGSGSTGIACKLEGFDFTGIEIDPEYIKIAEARINSVNQAVLA